MTTATLTRTNAREKALGVVGVGPFCLIELGRRGLTKSALVNLASRLGLPPGQMARFLPVTERTIQRYSSKDRFNQAVSEQLLQIAQVADAGERLFGNRERLLAWLNLPNTALGGTAPIDLLDSRFGAEMVLDLLGRIEYGVYS